MNKVGEIQAGNLVIFVRDFEIPRKLGVVLLAPVVVPVGARGQVMGIRAPFAEGNPLDAIAAQIQLDIPIAENIQGVWLPSSSFDAVRRRPKLNKINNWMVEYPVGSQYQSTQEDKIFEVLEHGIFALRLTYLGWVAASDFTWWVSRGLVRAIDKKERDRL